MSRPAPALSLGKLTLKSPVLYSPLAGFSDFPFRQMSARYSPGLMFCEMVNMEALVRSRPEVLNTLKFSKEMYPIGAQIFGCDPATAAVAAKMIEDLGFSVVDLNCGCPVDRLTNTGSGSALLKDPSLIGAILKEMRRAVKIPVTLKIRAGWDENNITAPLITKIAEEAGADAISIHARTREQAYRGRANWSYIKECKRAASTIKVIGNGDIFAPGDALKMLEETGCDGVLVSRGTLGEPWIAEDILKTLLNEPLSKRGFEEYRKALLDHFYYASECKRPHDALLTMRKVACNYFKNVRNASQIRGLVSKALSLEEMKHFIEQFDPDQ